MAKQSVTRNLIVGFVFLGSLAVLGAVTLFMSAIPIFTQAEALEVRFKDVGQLQSGDHVRAYGFRVGQVDSIRYDPDTSPSEPIVVRTQVLKNLKDRLREGTEYSVKSAGPLGGQYLEIRPPPELEERRDPTRPVGKTQADLFEQLSELRLGETVEEFRKTFESINNQEGPLGALVKDAAMRDRLSRAVEDASSVIAQIRTDLAEQKGTIGLLLSNEQTRQEIQDLVTEAREVVRSIREGKGVAAALLNDEDLVSRVREAVDDIHDIVHKVNTGQGTLGQVVNNPKAWDELVKILVLGRETVEDIREQAPISTFVGALFAAF